MQKQRSSQPAAAAARSPSAAAALRSSAASSFAFTYAGKLKAGTEAGNGPGMHAALPKGGRHADMLLPPQQCCIRTRLGTGHTVIYCRSAGLRMAWNALCCAWRRLWPGSAAVREAALRAAQAAGLLAQGARQHLRRRPLPKAPPLLCGAAPRDVRHPSWRAALLPAQGAR